MNVRNISGFVVAAPFVIGMMSMGQFLLGAVFFVVAGYSSLTAGVPEVYYSPIFVSLIVCGLYSLYLGSIEPFAVITILGAGALGTITYILHGQGSGGTSTDSNL